MPVDPAACPLVCPLQRAPGSLTSSHSPAALESESPSSASVSRAGSSLLQVAPPPPPRGAVVQGGRLTSLASPTSSSPKFK